MVFVLFGAIPVPLTDFLPLESLELPGLGAIDCSGLTLVVGPNSSGKSQLLRDIHQRLTGEPRPLVVATTVGIRKLEYEPLMQCLSDEGLIYKYTDDNGTPHIRPRTTYAGTGQAAAQIQTTQSQSWFQTHKGLDQSTGRRRDEYLGYFVKFLVTALFLENRLTALAQTGMIAFVEQPPQHDLHALHLNDGAKRDLLDEVRNAFAKAVWPDISGGTGVCLRVSDSPNVPTAEERHSPSLMAGFRKIETEGDGLKSYVAICVALLLGRRPVSIIDEPEMCLHPPQAYSLGRFIGKYGATKDGATFVATHSSHVLRGVLQTTPKLQVVRLTRHGGVFRAHLVASEQLSQALAKPTVRAETVLDGLFAQAVVVIEADGDRTVYQAVWETLAAEFRLDIHFTAVGGIGGIADTCALYKTLRIPVAVIADLDVIVDTDKLRRILNSLGCPETDAILTDAVSVSSAVRLLPPTRTVAEVKSDVLAALDSTPDWNEGRDSELARQLSRLARGIDRIRRLKSGGVHAIDETIRAPLLALVERLHAVGLFVVPVGELEQWLSAHHVEASKQNKWAWANEAAAKARAAGARDGDVWDFMRRIGRYSLTQYHDAT